MHPVEEIRQDWSAPAPVVQFIPYIVPSERATHTSFGSVGDKQYVTIRELGGLDGSTLSFIERTRRESEVE